VLRGSSRLLSTLSLAAMVLALGFGGGRSAVAPPSAAPVVRHVESTTAATPLADTGHTVERAPAGQVEQPPPVRPRQPADRAHPPARTAFAGVDPASHGRRGPPTR
jgi:hypothetical protein